jgi:DNA polymerase-3 subunit delta'
VGADDTDPPVPELFAEVVGQPAAVALLRSAARHPVHAYLFRGPPGSGIPAAARAFSAALLCPEGGCGECASCLQALAGSHPDVTVVERTGASLGVADARRLVGLAQRKPFLSARQVLVVADVHLATQSAPALLKTVEEPPATTVFVLLADDVPPELVTVASRCVEVQFPPVPTSAMVSWLVARGVEPGRAELIAEGADGDTDRARLLVEDAGYVERLDLWRSIPGRLDGHGATAAALARTVLATADTALEPLRARHAEELRALAEAAEAMGERGVPGKKDVTDRHAREERRWRADEIRAGLGVLARAYRNRQSDAVFGTGAGGADAADGGPAAAELRGYQQAVGLISDASRALRRNPNETLLLENLFVQLGGLRG